MLEERVALLQIISRGEYGVSDLAKKMRSRHEDTISLLKAMEQEGLIHFRKNSSMFAYRREKGRPKKTYRITVLGAKMLGDFQKCKRNMIQINDNDIRSSRHQISLRKSLEKGNISPYRRFFELNTIAFRIKNSVTR